MLFTRKQRLLLWLIPPVATALIRALCCTLRFQEELADGARTADRTPLPDVYVFWHRSLLMAAYRYRNLGARILISSSFDGELIARIVELLGFVAVRGSSSRGGAVGLLALTRARMQGHKIAITADGPRGPASIAKPGAAAVTLRSASTFSAFTLRPSNAWTLNSWDRFLIPKPFSVVRVVWTAPIALAPDTTLEAATAQIQLALEGINP